MGERRRYEFRGRTLNVTWVVVVSGGSAVDLLGHTQKLGLGPELAAPMGEWNASWMHQNRLGPASWLIFRSRKDVEGSLFARGGVWWHA